MIENNTSDLQIDLSYLKEFSNGDSGFEKKILESSILEVDEMIESLKFCISVGDNQKIISLAHSLKSLMYIIGFPTLHKYFYAIENKSCINEIDNNISNQLKTIVDKWTIAKNKLIKILNKYPETIGINLE